MTTERIRKDVLPTLKRMMEDGRGDEQVTFRQQVTSYPFGHAMPSQLVVQALSYGMEANVQSSKGIFARNHLITTRSSVKNTWVFWTTAQRWMEANA